jgi:putative membrane protein insertion efficiency factor
MKAVAQFVLRAYKRFISPMLPACCRYVPTCSEYATEAIEMHGVLRGSLMAVARLLRCHPFAKSGYDPVPSRRGVEFHPAPHQAASCPMGHGQN